MEFRRSYLRAAAASAGAAALCLLLLWYVGLVPLEHRPLARAACGVTIAGLGALALLKWLCVARERVVLDDEALVLRGLVGERRVRWGSVVGLAAPWGLYTDVPLVLRLTPRARGTGLLRLLAPRRVAIPGHWVGHERLVREVAARAPHAARNERLRAYLAEPRRVPWSHRVPLLVGLAVAAGAAAWALWDALVEGAVGAAAVAGSGVLCAVLGGSVGREWRPKLRLVLGYCALAVALFAVFPPAMVQGREGWLLVLLAACLGWAGATLAVCLPWRPRAAVVALAYVVAVAGAAGLTWHIGIRERVPVRSSALLRLGDASLAWSADGQRLAVYGAERPGGARAYLVLERPPLGARRLPVNDLAERLFLAGGGRAVSVTSRTQSADAPRTLLVWEAGRGEPRRVPVPPRVRLAPEGLGSPDGAQLALLALDEARGRWELWTVRLSDLAVARHASALDYSRFAKVRWGADGRLILTARQHPTETEPARLALWSLAPGGKAPVRFYEVSASDVWDRYSPDVRWALVALHRGGQCWERYELVDLVTGAARAVEFPLRPDPHQLVWSPDGAALAYAVCDGGGWAIVCYRPATGELSRIAVPGRGQVASLALSSGARFAACALRGPRAARVHVIELGTGRGVALRRPLLFPAPIEPSWSPAGQALAVTFYENPLPPDQAVRIRIFDFGRGW